MGDKLKRMLRVGGFLVSLLCCIYVGKEIFTRRELFQSGFGAELIVAMIVSCFLWVLVNVSLGIGWRSIVSTLGETISMKDSVLLSFRTQVAKYLPGNVFHLVGRAVLAKKLGVGMTSASMVVVLESLILILIACIFGISFLFRQNYFGTGLILLVGGVVVALFLCFKTSLRQRLGLPDKLNLTSKSAWLIVGISYGSVFLLQAGMFVAFALMVSETIRYGFFEILEMVSISWAAGFVVLGAPGGLGVREAVFSTFASTEELRFQLLYIASLMRVSSIFGDLICFGIGSFLLTPSSKKE